MSKPDLLSNYPPAYRRVMRAIKEYESDTFSGSDVTMQEAYQMTKAMIRSIADQLGSSIDGVMLTEIHEAVKELIKVEGEDNGSEE